MADEAVERADAKAVRAGPAAALARLKPGNRDALLLAAWADLTYAEIAATLDIPVRTVRSRINRARRRAGGGGGPLCASEYPLILI